MLFKIKKGLTIPLAGRPDERIDEGAEGATVETVAVLGADYIGLKPTMLVQQGDRVKCGTPLFEDKKNPGVIITSPAAGTVAAINRGAKRALESVVVSVEGDDAVVFCDPENVDLSQQSLREIMQKSGLWVALRTRPYGKVPAVDSMANSIFVNAMDTNPLAVDPTVIINAQASEFAMGVALLSKFQVPVYVCHGEGAKLPELSGNGIRTASFAGPHPAGLSSTHVHYIDPAHAGKSVWTIGYQDVIALAKLFTTGTLDSQRYVAVAGPLVNSPRIFLTRVGANISQLIENRLLDGKKRVISGSVLNGHTAHGALDYLGRYDNQVSVIEENNEREFMGWIAPGGRKFSALNVFLSNLVKPKSFNITTSQNGSPRALVPIGAYEQVMPLDILATPLLKSILVKDTDAAQELGCLELVEEDLALCSFVDPGKHDFGPVLRSTLSQIEKEG